MTGLGRDLCFATVRYFFQSDRGLVRPSSWQSAGTSFRMLLVDWWFHQEVDIKCYVPLLLCGGRTGSQHSHSHFHIFLSKGLPFNSCYSICQAEYSWTSLKLTSLPSSCWLCPSLKGSPTTRALISCSSIGVAMDQMHQQAPIWFSEYLRVLRIAIYFGKLPCFCFVFLKESFKKKEFGIQVTVQ